MSEFFAGIGEISIELFLHSGTVSVAQPHRRVSAGRLAAGDIMLIV